VALARSAPAVAGPNGRPQAEGIPRQVATRLWCRDGPELPVTGLQTGAEEAPRPSGIDAVRAIARQRFGINRLHREQERAISSILSGKDTLLVLPTGGGKSLCYQLPSLLLPHATVVVSPLLALLEDQYTKLKQLGIPAVRLDSTVGAVDRRAALAEIARGGPLLVMTTPETLAGNELGTLLEKVPPSLVAVDEAHCISEWGHNFRPDYLKLADTARALAVERVLALTATATPAVVDPGLSRTLGIWRNVWTDGKDLAREARRFIDQQLAQATTEMART